MGEDDEDDDDDESAFAQVGLLIADDALNFTWNTGFEERV